MHNVYIYITLCNRLYVSSPHLGLLAAKEYILQDNPFASVLGQHGLSCWTRSFAEDPGFHSTGRSSGWFQLP